MRAALAVLLVLSSLAAAHAFGIGKEGFLFGRLGASNRGKPVIQPTGKLLAVDGVSFILQTDGVSKICRAGGC